MKFILLTGRTLGQGRSKEIGKLSDEYAKNVGICEFDPEDLKSLQISPGQNVRVTTKHGTVVVKAALSTQAPHRGLIFMPYGPWTSMICDPETHQTGMPSLKGIEAEATPAPEEKVLTIRELVAHISGEK